MVRATLVAGVMMLPACESLFVFSDANVSRVRQEVIEEHRMRAIAWEDQGELRRALEAWRVVEALAPESEESRQRIRTLEKRIDAGVMSRMRAARNASRRDRLPHAKVQLLRVLALDPGHKGAADLLREVENRQVAAELATSSTEPQLKPYRETTDPYSSPSGGRGHWAAHDPSGRDHGQEEVAGSVRPTVPVERGEGDVAVRSAHLRLAAAYRAENKLEQALEHLEKAREQETAANGEVDRYIAETRAALAEQFYREGVRFFRSNLDQSIKAFERALAYNPEHERAKHYLSTAIRLRQQRKAPLTVPAP